MAYVGIQTMLLAYKMRKSDKEFELMQISQDLLAKQKESTKLSNEFIEAKGTLSKDDVNYAEMYESMNAQYNNELADLAAWEDELQTKQHNAETEIKYLNGYIEGWQQALQQNVSKAHNYGQTS